MRKEEKDRQRKTENVPREIKTNKEAVIEENEREILYLCVRFYALVFVLVLVFVCVCVYVYVCACVC